MTCSETANGGWARRERATPAHRHHHTTHGSQIMPTTHSANSIGSQLQVAANSPWQTCKDAVFWHRERRTST
eukprot:6737723-Alexandrium_andersonii.AAC.1